MGITEIGKQLLALAPKSIRDQWLAALTQNADYQASRTYMMFVYGTLKRGHHNHYILHEAQYRGRYTTIQSRYDLISFGHCPGLVYRPQNGYHIDGEMYVVDGPTLWTMDILEGKGELYERETVIAMEIGPEHEEAQISQEAHTYFIRNPHDFLHSDEDRQIWLDGDSNTKRWVIPLDFSEILNEKS